jgi:hypothetical protein
MIPWAATGHWAYRDVIECKQALNDAMDVIAIILPPFADKVLEALSWGVARQNWRYSVGSRLTTYQRYCHWKRSLPAAILDNSSTEPAATRLGSSIPTKLTAYKPSSRAARR